MKIRRRLYPKRKRRGFPLIRGGGVILVCIIFFRIWHGRYAHNISPVQKAGVIPQVDLPKLQDDNHLRNIPEKEEQPIVHVARRGDTFSGIFSQFNLKGRDLSLILQAFRQLDVTTLFPGDSIVVKRTCDSSFSLIHFFTSLQNKFTISNNDSLIIAQREVVPVSTYTYLLKGVLETSLSEAMFTLGVGDNVTAAVADIFAWDINFFIDPRKGDAFEVIFEKKVVDGRTIGYGQVLAAKYTLSLNNKCYYAIGLPGDNGRINYYDCEGNALQKQFLKAPLRYSRVSSGFSHQRMHPILGIVRPHLGIDYAAPYGTPVYAAADGRIVFIGRKGEYGNMIIISHGSAYQTFYGHLQNFARNIYKGAFVKQGDIVGNVGASGLATGPHLDYRMQRGGCFVNPMKIVSPSLKTVSRELENVFLAFKEKYLYLFEKRFGSQNGCFLIDISVPLPVEPRRYIINKDRTVADANG